MLWLGSAVLLHGVLVTALVPWGEVEQIQPPMPIQVSLLEPASPVQAPLRPAPPDPQKPVPTPPKPVAKPKPVATPVPLSQVPVADPVAAAPAESTPVAAAAATSASAAPASGGALVEARFDADYLQNPAPVYPPLSRRMGEEGKVMLRAYVLPSGRPESVELRHSSGSTRLDEAALAAVRKWRFVPARRGSEAVAAWVLIPISFRLES